MKLLVTVRQLSFGISYFDVVNGVYCSFYDVLPNSLMDNWVEPGPDLPYRDKRAEAEGNAVVETCLNAEGNGGEDDDDQQQEGRAGDSRLEGEDATDPASGKVVEEEVN